MGDQNLLSGTPPCFGRHVKPLVPVAFAFNIPTLVSRRVDVKLAASRINNCGIFITTSRKHVVLTPLSGIRVGKRKKDF
jgi:hypothetical protein